MSFLMLNKLSTKKIKSLCAAVSCIAVLNGCSTAKDAPPLTDAFNPINESLDLSTDNKPKKAVETPTGVKYVYDPYQDEDLKIAFRALMQIKQQAGYFEGWPKRKLARAQQKGPVGGLKEEWVAYLNTYRLAATYEYAVRRAHMAQRHDYASAGCEVTDHRHCLRDFYWEPCFEPKPVKQTNGISVRLSRCEPIPVEDIPIPSLSLNAYTYKGILGARVCAGEKLPFVTAHVGDPKRGSFQKQFKDHYSMQCTEWRENDN